MRKSSRAFLSTIVLGIVSSFHTLSFAETNYFDEYVRTLDRTCQNGDLVSCAEGASLGYKDLIDKKMLEKFLDGACDLGSDGCAALVSLYNPELPKDGFGPNIEKYIYYLKKGCQAGDELLCDKLEKISSYDGNIDSKSIKNDLKLSNSDRDAQPLVRIPPMMPPRFLEGENSGFCRVKFDVSPDGQPFNVETTYCTSASLARPTIQSVQKWKYNPKIVDGSRVARTGVESKVTSLLQDERGRPLPFPEK